jgi:hypothetical protein
MLLRNFGEPRSSLLAYGGLETFQFRFLLDLFSVTGREAKKTNLRRGETIK